ncbi:hypothetical protein U472_00275 [Orenia metallireducens]|uniref:Uncharacterized protein n=1 Tax=Orenia metallireducens TaxID=1413210 RepID=A0A1C0ADB0_9FIRM|nr:hypothetical protein U472_00275 [Orenia metallireducens]
MMRVKPNHREGKPSHLKPFYQNIMRKSISTALVFLFIAFIFALDRSWWGTGIFAFNAALVLAVSFLRK